jgi:hypothetical protein
MSEDNINQASNENQTGENLQSNVFSGNIDATAGQATGAAPETGAEDAAGYQSIIEQHQKQIDALIARNESLTSQFSRLIANGAQVGEPATAAQQQQMQQQQQKSPYEDIPSLADIGKSLVNKKE